MEATEKKPRKTILLIFAFLIIVGSCIATFAIAATRPVMPIFSLLLNPCTHTWEKILCSHLLGRVFYITNTMISVWMSIIIILVIGWNINKQLKQGKMVLTGVAGAIAALLEGFYGMTEGIAGKWAKKIFPYFATIFLLVLFVNLQELVPGPDAFGYLHESAHGTPKLTLLGGAVETIVRGEEAHAEDEHAEEATVDEHSEEAHGGYTLVPFWRVASTDLNFTLSLALISVVMTQFMGFKALGGGYLAKFFPFKEFAATLKPPINPIEIVLGFSKIFAGILELIAEFAKIVSFTFRLFGVIFAGSVLLFFIGAQVGGVGQSIVVLLELIFGPLQALVFGLLTMIFMSMATPAMTMTTKKSITKLKNKKLGFFKFQEVLNHGSSSSKIYRSRFGNAWGHLVPELVLVC